LPVSTTLTALAALPFAYPDILGGLQRSVDTLLHCEDVLVWE
jgi:hypothetical protein